MWDSKFFTPEIRLDTDFISSFNHPKDDTIAGSTEIFRSNEVQIEQISFGGDFHWQNVRGRILTMGGMFGVTTPRNDASVGRGQWDLRGAYKYFSEAYGGYHFNVNHGLNVDAGIFVFIHRIVQLLQLRQLGVSAAICIVEHTLVFQRSSRAVVPHRQIEDRAMVHQWMAILWQVRQHARLGWTDLVPSDAVALAGFQ